MLREALESAARLFQGALMEGDLILASDMFNGAGSIITLLMRGIRDQTPSGDVPEHAREYVESMEAVMAWCLEALMVVYQGAIGRGCLTDALSIMH